MSALRSTFGIAVQVGAREAPPPPDVLTMFRTCEPTPALLKLLSDSAKSWAEAGRIDDACACLALALCVRSALLAELTTGDVR